MAEDDVFGDFSSAFPVGNSSTTVPAASTSVGSSDCAASGLKGDQNMDIFASFPFSTSSMAAGSCPVTFTQQPHDGNLSFDAFSTCSLSTGRDSLPGFADFSQFNSNIADITIPPPTIADDIGLHLGMFEIPPLPEQLDLGDEIATSTTGPNSTHPAEPLPVPTSMDNSVFTLDTPHPLPPSSTQQLFFTSDEISTSLSKPASSLNGTQAGEPNTSANMRISTLTTSFEWPEESGTKESTVGPSNDSDSDFGEFESSFDASRGISFASVQVSIPDSGSSDSRNPEPTPQSSDLRTSSSELLRADQQESNVGAFGKMSGGEVTTSFQLATENVNSANGSRTENPHSDDFGAFMTIGAADVVESTTGKEFTADFSAFGSSEREGAGNQIKTNTRFELQSPHISSTTLEFAGFAAFQQSGKDISSDLGEFGNFEDSTSTPPVSKQANSDFGGFQAGEKAGHSKFGKFAAAGSSAKVGGEREDEFGEFGSFASAPSNKDGKEGSHFAASSMEHTSQSQPKAEFGSFSSSGHGNNQFADFEAAPAATKDTNTQAQVSSADVLVVCFPSAGRSTPPQAVPAAASLQGSLFTVESVWHKLQSCVDFTVPLYKWDKSYLQDCYYNKLKVDPTLLARVGGAIPLLPFTPGSFVTLLGSQSAAEDLMESFGFEGELETTNKGTPLSEFNQETEESAPALLDLSLPPTPSAETQKDSFSVGLAADLLGLDLNPTTSQKLTSIQELLLNERLVVNRSTWMDSQLLELGGGEQATPPERSPSHPSTPLSTRKQPSFEQQLLQLGLDASKMTLSSVPAQKELSFSARTTLGRLPDTSFMLADTVVGNVA